MKSLPEMDEEGEGNASSSGTRTMVEGRTQSVGASYVELPKFPSEKAVLATV